MAKGKVVFAISLAALAGIAIACSSAQAPEPIGLEDKPGSRAADAPKRGGTLRIVGTVTGPGHNDPHLSAAASGRDFSVPVSNYLLRRDIYDEKYPIIGDLAKSWEVSNDGLTYTFKLHEGAKYHNIPPSNGREFTSEDAKYNAIHLAIDRHQFKEVIGEGLGTISGPVTPIYRDLAGKGDEILSQPGYRADKAQDMAEAKRLMEQAGYGDGFRVRTMTITGGAYGDAASLVAEQLKPLKILFNIEILEYGVWISKSTQSDFELGLLTFTLGTDADSLLTSHLHSKGGRNYGKYNDPELDKLIELQRRTVNVEERRKWAREAENRILEQSPMLFLLTRVDTQVFQPQVNGVSSGLLIGDTLMSVEKAWLAD